jgi:Sulfotransferase family
MTMPQYTLCYILGSGHCGSTLLDLMLNGHSEVLGLGEVVGLKSDFKALISDEAREFPQWYRSFWNEVKRRYESLSGEPFEQINVSHPTWKTLRSWRPADLEAWTQYNKMLFSCIQQISGARILTDSSKFPHRLYLLQRSRIFDIRVIHLVRDGRAVINSYIRKYNNFYIGFRRWATPALLAFHLRRQFSRDHWLQIRYESLATKPESTLKCICDLINIDFESEMLAYRSRAYLGIGGNRMRMRSDEMIHLDDQWKRQLRSKHRIGFALIAGWLNMLYGY